MASETFPSFNAALPAALNYHKKFQWGLCESFLSTIKKNNKYENLPLLTSSAVVIIIYSCELKPFGAESISLPNDTSRFVNDWWGRIGNGRGRFSFRISVEEIEGSRKSNTRKSRWTDADRWFIYFWVCPTSETMELWDGRSYTADYVQYLPSGHSPRRTDSTFRKLFEQLTQLKTYPTKVSTFN